MKHVLVPSIVLVALLSVTVVAADLESGLQEGDAAGFFLVKDCTGPSADTSLCYRCQYGAKPVVNIFARSLSPGLATLVKELDEQVGKNSDKNMRGFVVLLTDDPDQAEAELKAFAKKHKIEHMPLTYFDGVSGPASYKIAKDADVTVNMWVNLKSKANHAFAKDDLKKKSIAKIVGDSAKILQ
jgi:hypothetical protein